MESAPRTLLCRLLCGLIAGLVAVALRASLQPLMGDELPFLIAFPATVLTAVTWGGGAGALVAVLCALAAALPGIPPGLNGAARPLQIGGFLVGSILLAIVCGQLAEQRRAALAATGEPGSTLQIPETPLGA